MDWKSKKVRAILEAALAEDKAAEDVSTALTIDPKRRGTGTVVARQPCVVAGVGMIPVLLEIFGGMREKAGMPPLGRFEIVSHPEIFDGVRVKKGQTIAVIRGNAAALLSTERVMMNLLQHLSGISTLTAEYVRAVKGTKTRVLDTRKTMPGLRSLEKYAVCCGGGVTHRTDLADGVLLRNNHIAVGGGLAKTLETALKFSRGRQVVQVEVRSAEELEEAIAGGAGAILLGGMTPAAAKKSVKRIRESLPHATVGISGNLTPERVKEFAAVGVDFVAASALTQSAPAADLAMRIVADVS